MSNLAPEILERRDRAKVWFESLQTRIIAELERLEDEAPPELYPDDAGRFDLRPWTRETGTGGGIGGHLKGNLFEKAGIHTSAATAKFSPEMAKSMPGAAEDPSYVSASISLIIHPRSPRVPTVHMNTRFLSTAQSWFGGGADLTPMLDEQRSQEADDTVLFHAAMRAACETYDPDCYPRFKQWCDEYFYLPHRGEMRGIGGIFYDQLNSGDFERDFAFTRAVGEAFLDVYPKIVRHRMSEPWTEQDRQEQLVRRGRYVEFNLLYDRGTMFGLKAGGNIETILSSMPPLVAWTVSAARATRRALLALAALALPLGAAGQPANPRVALETPQGRIVLEIDAAHAPVTAANFLAYVDGGLFKGATFYRVVRPDNDRNPATITVIQGGLGDGPPRRPPIAHETTRATGLKHLAGTISMARDKPGSATSEFFIVAQDAPALDFGGARNADGQGFAAFGHVVQGLDVVRRINAGRASGGDAYVKGQMLDRPVPITAVTRLP